MTVALYGFGVSRGVAIGRACILARGALDIVEYAIPNKFVDEEVARFEAALATARRQLKEIRNHIPTNTPVDIAAFIDTHLLMMEDTSLATAPIHSIRTIKCNAEWALKLQRDALVRVFDQIDDPYLRTRKDDIDHVVNRIQRILLNESTHLHDAAATGNRLNGYIVLADDLSPADTVFMQHQGVVAFVTEYGGATSHTTILARSLGIPAIVGVRNARRYFQPNEQLIVDGQQGLILATKDPAIVDYYRGEQAEEQRHREQLSKTREKPAISLDRETIALYANIELPEDLSAIARAGAKGVGLYRTELLFMNRDDTPGEEEQFNAYRQVVEAMKGALVTIRTLDIGADKQISGLNGTIPANPALGLRAIRLCLKDPSLFKPQLRAILRASVYGQVRMMVPMLSTLHEVLHVMQLVEDSKRELRHQGREFNAQMPLGGMIEVPAAALSADLFAKHLDFLSIGTNDLIQYTIATDRIDDSVNYLYDPLHPAVLRLIQMTIDAGRRAAIPVGMCGEMAGDSKYTRLLLGMGLREFSMHPTLILEVKRIVRASNVAVLSDTVNSVISRAHPDEIVALVNTLNRDDF